MLFKFWTWQGTEGMPA